MNADLQTYIHTDVLVIGSGIAGLSFAIKLAETIPDKNILLLSKRALLESNTKYAQGGIAVVQNFELDSFEKHVSDTLVAGDGLCDPAVVRFVVEEGPQRLEELVSWGTHFDLAATPSATASDKPFHLGKEGGHSAKRIVHFKDSSGYEIQQSLIAKVKRLTNIRVLEDHTLVDLITNHHLKATKKGAVNIEDLSKSLNESQILESSAEKKQSENQCYGAYVISQKDHEIIKITAQATILSTGGAGQVYAYTTNPEGATGDGLAAAYRAKVSIENLHYVQFHPTALALAVGTETFLISEAVRGAGAILRNSQGHAFMVDYDPRKDLAPRDIVARAIELEIKKQHEANRAKLLHKSEVPAENFIYLDATALGLSIFEDEFPNIYKACLSVGINPLREGIPVVPAAHYFCGGIAVNEHSQSSLKGLYAIGECSHTGLHGANRLASNSLLEALVFAHRAALKVGERLFSAPVALAFFEALPPWHHALGDLEKSNKAISEVKLALQQTMSEKGAIFKTNKGLLEAEAVLADLYKKSNHWYHYKKLSLQICELRNLVSVAYLIIKQSQSCKENRGGFFNKDLANLKGSKAK